MAENALFLPLRPPGKKIKKGRDKKGGSLRGAVDVDLADVGVAAVLVVGQHRQLHQVRARVRRPWFIKVLVFDNYSCGDNNGYMPAQRRGARPGFPPLPSCGRTGVPDRPSSSLPSPPPTPRPSRSPRAGRRPERDADPADDLGDVHRRHLAQVVVRVAQPHLPAHSPPPPGGRADEMWGGGG